jgi:hypothetical protein
VTFPITTPRRHLSTTHDPTTARVRAQDPNIDRDPLSWDGTVYFYGRKVFTIRQLRRMRHWHWEPHPVRLTIVDVEPGAEEFAALHLPKPTHRISRTTLRFCDGEACFNRWIYRRKNDNTNGGSND